MKLTSFEAITAALERAQVRYLIAGGLAVNAHGHPRFTNDIDLVIELVPDNLMRAFAALGELGYRPSIPVSSAEVADPARRESWIREKGMQVLQLWSDAHRETPIDIFVTEPFDFDAEYAAALIKLLREGLPIRFVSRNTLIEMKQAADRPQDRLDVEHLRAGVTDDD